VPNVVPAARGLAEPPWPPGAAGTHDLIAVEHGARTSRPASRRSAARARSVALCAAPA